MQANEIPTKTRDAQTHTNLHALLKQREGIEQDLYNMHADVAADGTPLDPQRDWENEYQRSLTCLQTKCWTRTVCCKTYPWLLEYGRSLTKALPKQKFYQFFPYIAVNIETEPEQLKLKSKTVTFPNEMWEKGVLYRYYDPH